jgi:hypothetical protein
MRLRAAFNDSRAEGRQISLLHVALWLSVKTMTFRFWLLYCIMFRRSDDW